MFSDTGKQKNWSENKAVFHLQPILRDSCGIETKNTAAHTSDTKLSFRKAREK
jgi:hypothetical protein